MKILIAYYSRTGITKKVAENLQKLLNCDIEEIIDTKDRTGPKGYLLSGRDALFKKLTKLKEVKKDPSKYDLIIIGSPVWSFHVSTPVRTYINENLKKFKKVAFFCTMGGSGDVNTFNDMKDLCKQDPLSKLTFLTKEVIDNSYEIKLKNFIKEIL